MRPDSDRPTTLPDARGLRFALVVSRFNHDVTGRLLAGARDALAAAGAAAVEVQHVPGAFELPFAADRLARTGRFDAVIGLGCLVRGDTPHFEYISAAVAHGLMRVALDTGRPVAFGVLTCETLDQALARARPDETNKGVEAAAAAIEMARFAIGASPPAGTAR